jgi:hypothetical protein
MNDPERSNNVVETLLADRSPAAQARHLNVKEQRMLLLAQRLRGSREQGPDPAFAEALDFWLWRCGSSSTRPGSD